MARPGFDVLRTEMEENNYITLRKITFLSENLYYSVIGCLRVRLSLLATFAIKESRPLSLLRVTVKTFSSPDYTSPWIRQENSRSGQGDKYGQKASLLASTRCSGWWFVVFSPKRLICACAAPARHCLDTRLSNLPTVTFSSLFRHFVDGPTSTATNDIDEDEHEPGPAALVAKGTHDTEWVAGFFPSIEQGFPFHTLEYHAQPASHGLCYVQAQTKFFRL